MFFRSMHPLARIAGVKLAADNRRVEGVVSIDAAAAREMGATPAWLGPIGSDREQR